MSYQVGGGGRHRPLTIFVHFKQKLKSLVQSKPIKSTIFSVRAPLLARPAGLDRNPAANELGALKTLMQFSVERMTIKCRSPVERERRICDECNAMIERRGHDNRTTVT